MDRSGFPTAHDTAKSWEGFLTPSVLRGKLISASIYLAAFELLNDSIIERIRTFFFSGFDQNGIIVGPDYQSEVLSRNTSPLYASVSWLLENNAIDDKDLETFESLKKLRNRVAHEMHQLVTSDSQKDYLAELSTLVALIRKIEVWWVVNIELPTNPDWDGTEEVDEDSIVPGSFMAVSLMCDIALGSEENANRYLKAWRELKSKPKAESE
jgi:hypothetical protein